MNIKAYLENPYRIFYRFNYTKVSHLLSDKALLKLIFRARMGKKLDLNDPESLNEKLQWLKLNDRHPEYTTMVDKYAVKDYISDTIGRDYVIPTLGVWNSFDEIDFEKMPNRFVLKCTHGTGGIVLCKDKNQFDIASAKRIIEKVLHTDYYLRTREWPYKNVPRRIIAEPYLVDESGWELKDYKIFCFNGKPEYVEVDFNRFIEHKLNPYDFDWNPLNFCDSSKNDYAANIPKPKRLMEMKRIAKILSKDIDFLRVDFYSIDDKIFVGELTFYPGSGFIKFDPKETDLYYGNKLKLTGLKERVKCIENNTI